MKITMRALGAVTLLVALLVTVLFALSSAGNPATASTPSSTPCTPSEAWVETITDSPAWTEEVFDHWQRYSWTGGPHASDDPPAFPSDDWQANVQGDPHGIGVGGAYFRSHGNSGNGDWFYLEAVTTTVLHEEVTHNVEHPAVTCPEEPTETPTDPTSTPPIVTEPPVTETPSPTTPQETVTVESDPIYIPDDQPKKDVPDVRKPSSGRPLPNTGA